VHIETDRLPKPVDDDVRRLLLQGARELLLNVAKHAGAGEATVSLERAGPYARVTVRDRGRGFDATSRPATPTPTGGFGLFNLRERLELMGGAMEVESRVGEGTTVRITAPLRLT
jgi:signal transduction histidine kinase